MSNLVETPERLKQSILQEAMQGKLTKQLPSDGNADDLLRSIRQKKQQLIQSGKIRKHKRLSPISKNKIPFKIPKNWEWCRLTDVGYITSGGTPRKSVTKYWDSNDIPWITPKFLGKHRNNINLYSVNNYISNKGLRNSSAQLIPKGSIVYSSRAPIGYLNIVNFNFTTNQGAKSITPIFVNKYYLYYMLINRTKSIKKHASGTTFKEISKTKLGISLIPLPPLAEQHRIVQRLNEILPKVDDLNKDVIKLDQIRTKFPHRLKQSLLLEAMKGHLTYQLPSDGNADDLLQSIQQKKQQLIQAGKIRKHKKLPPISKNEIPFKIPKNWKWVRLQDICNYIQKGKSPKYSKVGYPILNQKCIRWDGINFNFHKNISLNVFNTFNEHRLLKSGDILWNTTGTGTLGRLSIVTSRLLLNHPKIVVNGDVMIIRSSSKTDSVYLLKFLSSPIIQKYLDKIITGSTKQIHLNLSVVLSLVIPLPPLNEQHRIVSKLHDLFNIINN